MLTYIKPALLSVGLCETSTGFAFWLAHSQFLSWNNRAMIPPCRNLLGIPIDGWIWVSLSLLPHLLFPHKWVQSGWTQEVCGQCGTQSALMYFLHLLWFPKQGPEHSWSRGRCRAVCAWTQLCQHSRALVQTHGSLVQSIPRLHNHLQL